MSTKRAARAMGGILSYILYPILSYPILQRSRQNRHLIGRHSGPASHFILRLSRTPDAVLSISVLDLGHVNMLSAGI
jgi:hypothetical protein